MRRAKDIQILSAERVTSQDRLLQLQSIQNAENVVPMATRVADKVCSQPGTRSRPTSLLLFTVQGGKPFALLVPPSNAPEILPDLTATSWSAVRFTW